LDICSSIEFMSWLGRVALTLLLLVAGGSAQLCAAKEDPVQWSLSAARGSEQVSPGGSATLELKAAIQDGWHLYSPTTPAGGPIVTKMGVGDSAGVTSWQIYRPKPVRKLDPNFQIDTETYTQQALFLVQVTAAKSASGMIPVTVSLRYQACSDVKCLPPVKKTVTAQLAVSPGAPPVAFSIPDGYAAVAAPAAVVAGGATAPKPQPVAARVADPDLLPFLLTAFGAGLLALFTPCVFPMIPITVSFFLNQNQGEKTRGGLGQAFVFCAGIIVLFTGLGFLVTAVAGPFGVVQLGSSPWVNGFIAAVFLVFGLSLLGAFELTLPTGLLTSLDRASQGGGYAGSLLMGLTFSLTSFACIGPIVGPLLIASVQSKGWQPVLGMLAFATGLALPFFLLALFPAYLKKLPRSGGWMTRVKIVLGFIVLAVMLKYLSNIDQVLQSHWLSRERFLSTWIVLFALPGLYLLGLLRLEGIKKDEPLGVGRTLLAAAFLIFAITLVPGLFGARLGDLDAFVPEGSAIALAPGAQSTAASAVFKNNLDGALAAAREQHKLVLIDFTGYACTNCHWMKANMFSRPEIAAAVDNLVVVELYTDGTDADSDKNQKLEDQKFSTASIPFYAIVDPDQNVVATFPQLTRDAHEFLSFLQTKLLNDRRQNGA
jgi:thiol:disulfide interchange protein